MMLYEGVILTFIVVGIIMIIVSFVFTRYDHFVNTKEKEKIEAMEDKKIDYDEVRDKILELNEYGEYLKDELDKKHKELLFLYQMIIEKQKEMNMDKLTRDVGLKSRSEVGSQGKGIEKLKTNIEHNQSDSHGNRNNINSNNENASNNKQRTSKDSKNYNKEILDMSLAGYDATEIAKKLNIGKGQVELVLNLYK